MSTNLSCSGVMPNTLEIHTALRKLNEFGCSSRDWICPICTRFLLTPLEEFKQQLSSKVIRWLSIDEGHLSTDEVYLSTYTGVSEFLVLEA
ncbi:hypothetical protein Taro_009078 [Colocasia esculenta]|uniref:Uncharacterized protein n=1 Tax=Colocasia esculenta TaxID=4460 RepID=A0A843TVF7_COLES|nr:hypothetical protein [Colocasia esculenta]